MKELKKYLQDLVDQHQIAGGAFIIHKDGKELFHQSVGYADIKAKRPIRDDSIYRLMSMSKVITTVGVMKLIEDKKIELDDPISKYIPAYSQLRVEKDARYELKADIGIAEVARLSLSQSISSLACILLALSMTFMPMLCLTHLNVMLNVQSGASKI